MLLCFVDRRKKRRKDRKTTHATAQATVPATAHDTAHTTCYSTRYKTRKNTQATTDSQTQHKSQHKSQRDICPPVSSALVHLHVCCRRYKGGWEEGGIHLYNLLPTCVFAVADTKGAGRSLVERFLYRGRKDV